MVIPKEINLFERKNEEILCPYCKTEQDQETKYSCVTFWGDDGHKQVSCDHCGKEFFVKEFVTREFATYKIEEDSDDF